MRNIFSWHVGLLMAAIAGLVLGCCDIPWMFLVADGVANAFMRLLQLVSLPLIFLSLTSTLTGMGGMTEVASLGRRVVQYTLLTTILAAAIALGLFVFLEPVSIAGATAPSGELPVTVGYLEHLRTLLPSNLLEPFIKNQVMGVLFIALAVSLATLKLPEEQRTTLHKAFSLLFSVIMQLTRGILLFIPLAIFAFSMIFVRDVGSLAEGSNLLLYIACVVAANIVQAVVVLPIILWLRGGNPVHLARAMLPGLAVAFFSKSSSAALPTVMECAEQRAGMRPRVSRFSFPLCSTVNMNACAAFILITVLFVAMSEGMVFAPWELVSWIFIATLAAVGNAGVPMGCYLLSQTFLAAMGVDPKLLVLITPVYSFIDMLESAINVWSDACVTSMVDCDVARAEAAA